MEGVRLRAENKATVEERCATTFTVIVPAYNIGKHINRCLESIQAISLYNLEIIIVDDGSTDGTALVCEQISRGDRRMEVVRQSNAGLSVARNAGLARAHGEYVAFVDGDDYISPESLIAAIDRAYDEDADVVVGGAFVVDQAGLTHTRRALVEPGSQMFTGAEYLEAALAQNRMSMCVPYSIYRRALLVEHGIEFEPGLYHEDELWSPQVFLAAERVVCTSPFYFHLKREDSIMTGGNHGKRSQDLQRVVELLASQVDALPESKLKRVLNDNLVSLFLNAVYLGGIPKKRTNWSLRPVALHRRAMTMRNKLRAYLYLANPRVYVITNSATKGMTHIVTSVRGENVAKVDQ